VELLAICFPFDSRLVLVRKANQCKLGSHPLNLLQPPEFWDIAMSPARFIGVQCTHWQSCKTAGLCVGGDWVVNLVLLGKCCGDSGANAEAYWQPVVKKSLGVKLLDDEWNVAFNPASFSVCPAALVG
jgi:hypothetical protein